LVEERALTSNRFCDYAINFIYGFRLNYKITKAVRSL